MRCASSCRASVRVRSWTLEQLLEVHRRLLSGTLLDEARRRRAHRAELDRRQRPQSLLGRIRAAAHPSTCPTCSTDLCAFCNEDSLPAVAQAAIAHAQFETIHPFVDGNGRTGRAPDPPGSAPARSGDARARTRSRSCWRPGRGTTSTDSPPTATAARHPRAPRTRGSTCGSPASPRPARAAVADAVAFEARIARIEEDWRERLGSVREGSALDLLVRAIPGAPLFTATGAAALIDRSFIAANEAIARLLDAGIVRQVSMGRRNRALRSAGDRLGLHRSGATAGEPRRGYEHRAPVAQGSGSPGEALTPTRARSAGRALILPARPSRLRTDTICPHRTRPRHVSDDTAV